MTSAASNRGTRYPNRESARFCFGCFVGLGWVAAFGWRWAVNLDVGQCRAARSGSKRLRRHRRNSRAGEPSACSRSWSPSRRVASYIQTRCSGVSDNPRRTGSLAPELRLRAARRCLRHHTVYTRPSPEPARVERRQTLSLVFTMSSAPAASLLRTSTMRTLGAGSQ